MGAAELARRYAKAGSISALARELGVPYSTLHGWLRSAGVEIRSAGFKSPKSRSRRGASHHKWKGGTYRQSDGYIYEYAPEHPAAETAKGYVLQHRLVMERAIGRYLTAEELVHHRNEIKDDNRVENLEIKSRSVHVRYHKATAARDERGRFSTSVS